MSITHTQQIVGQDNPGRQISKNAWNDDHTLAAGGSGESICRIQTGTYTGDGTVSQAITGIGFQPKYVRIWVFEMGAGNRSGSFMRMDEFTGDISYTNYYDVIGSNWVELVSSNYIISLDSDGFTVDDGGTDSHPNKDGIEYIYLTLG